MSERGCGERKTDSIYFESRLAINGRPIEEFIIDPPIDCKNKGISWSRSYQIFKKDGVNHLIDWVGEEYYESPWDFIEECRVKGMSRRVQKSFDFTKIVPGESQIFFAHKKAIDLTTKTKINLVKANRFPVTEIDLTDKRARANAHYGTRTVGDLKYKVEAYNPNKPVIGKDFRAGLFLRMPITNIVYVRPADKKMLEKISNKQLNIEVVNE